METRRVGVTRSAIACVARVPFRTVSPHSGRRKLGRKQKLPRPLACMAGVQREGRRGNLGTRGKRERDPFPFVLASAITLPNFPSSFPFLRLLRRLPVLIICSRPNSRAAKKNERDLATQAGKTNKTEMSF